MKLTTTARVLSLLCSIFLLRCGASAQTPPNSCESKTKTYDEFFWKLEIPIIRPDPAAEVKKDIDRAHRSNHQDCERFCVECGYHTLTHKHMDGNDNHDVNSGTGRELKKAAKSAGQSLTTLIVDDKATAAWEYVRWQCVCSSSANTAGEDSAGGSCSGTGKTSDVLDPLLG